MKNRYALVAQLDRATGFYPVGYVFESHREYRIRDVVQSGRTLALGARGRWFKSSHLDHRKKCGFSYIQLYLYMSGYDCSSFGQLYDSIRFARYNIYNIRYSLLGMDDKVY